MKDPLSQATKTIKEAEGSSINHNRETYRRDTMCYPYTQFLPKATYPQQIQQETLAN